MAKKLAKKPVKKAAAKPVKKTTKPSKRRAVSPTAFAAVLEATGLSELKPIKLPRKKTTVKNKK